MSDARAVQVPSVVIESILEHAERDAPHECCGLLIGRGNVITEAVPASNAADDPSRRYVIAPEQHFAQVRRCRADGLDIVGAYHSHPRSVPEPSPTDAAEAFGEFVYLIAGRDPGTSAWQIRAWRFEAGNFTAVRLVIERQETPT